VVLGHGPAAQRSRAAAWGPVGRWGSPGGGEHAREARAGGKEQRPAATSKGGWPAVKSTAGDGARSGARARGRR